jgi:tripartite-type tricarboxylate transporter receptor subunit TctC
MISALTALRRSRAVALAITLAGLPSAVAAQTYPSKPITLVVAFAPGGSADSVTRILVDKLGTKLGGASIVVENRGGAGGNLGARLVAVAPADGHTVLVTTTAVAINDTLYRTKGYATEDLRPVALAASFPEVLACSIDNPAKDLPDFLRAVKDKGVSYSSAGVGTPSFIQAEYFFKTLAKIKAVHVPFAGGGPAVSAAMGNHVDAVASALPTAAQLLNQGRLKGLAVASRDRAPAVPGVPTYAEGGFPDYLALTWVGFFVPSKTDDAVVAKLNAAINDTLVEADVQQRLRQIAFEPMRTAPAEAATYVRTEIEDWGKRVRAIGHFVD